MPAQPLLTAAALVYEVIAVIDQELQLAQPFLAWAGMIEPRLPQRRTRDRERVDRVGLAADPARPP